MFALVVYPIDENSGYFYVVSATNVNTATCHTPELVSLNFEQEIIEYKMIMMMLMMILSSKLV
jgi:hypothetical protein